MASRRPSLTRRSAAPASGRRPGPGASPTGLPNAGAGSTPAHFDPIRALRRAPTESIFRTLVDRSSSIFYDLRMKEELFVDPNVRADERSPFRRASILSDSTASTVFRQFLRIKRPNNLRQTIYSVLANTIMPRQRKNYCRPTVDDFRLGRPATGLRGVCRRPGGSGGGLAGDGIKTNCNLVLHPAPDPQMCYCTINHVPPHLVFRIHTSPPNTCTISQRAWRPGGTGASRAGTAGGAPDGARAANKLTRFVHGDSTWMRANDPSAGSCASAEGGSRVAPNGQARATTAGAPSGRGRSARLHRRWRGAVFSDCGCTANSSTRILPTRNFQGLNFCGVPFCRKFPLLKGKNSARGWAKANMFLEEKLA